MQKINPDLYLADVNFNLWHSGQRKKPSVKVFSTILAVSCRTTNSCMILLKNENYINILDFTFPVRAHHKEEDIVYNKDYYKYLDSQAVWINNNFLIFKLLDKYIKCRK